MSAGKVEEKLFQNRYVIDAGHPHIRIVDQARCQSGCRQPCLVCCPAGCYTLDGSEVVLITDGCLECGTCRVVCLARNLEWEYPRGGYGIQFKFG
ncbi:MAG: ferredoxin family protein [Betaproteobacteria bacterium]|nr:ferredoxin family protein [Betaproteobacteria bacterium]